MSAPPSLCFVLNLNPSHIFQGGSEVARSPAWSRRCNGVRIHPWQSGCSMGFSDGRSILALVQQILQGTAAYVSLPPIEVVPLSMQGQVFLIALDNRRLACFVIAQVMLGIRRQVIVPVRFVCSNELRGHRLRRFHRTAMFGIRRRIKMRGHLPLVVSIHGRRPFVNYTVNHPYHRRQSVRASARRQSL